MVFPGRPPSRRQRLPPVSLAFSGAPSRDLCSLVRRTHECLPSCCCYGGRPAHLRPAEGSGWEAKGGAGGSLQVSISALVVSSNSYGLRTQSRSLPLVGTHCLNDGGVRPGTIEIYLED